MPAGLQRAYDGLSARFRAAGLDARDVVVAKPIAGGSPVVVTDLATAELVKGALHGRGGGNADLAQGGDQAARAALDGPVVLVRDGPSVGHEDQRSAFGHGISSIWWKILR